MKQLIPVFLLIAYCFPSKGQNLTDSPAAFYSFDGSGNDMSGNGYHLTAVNVTDTTDRFGNKDFAYWFNGTDSYFFFSDWKKLFSNNFSFSCWIYIDTFPNYGTQNLILNIGGTTKDAGIQISYRHLGTYTGMGIYSYQTINAAGTFNAPLPLLGEWTHLTGTRDNDSLSFWVNGKLWNRVETKYDVELLGLKSGFFIGCKQGASNFFKGRIDDVRIYKRVLKDDEIKILSEETLNVSEIQNSDMVISIFPNPSKRKLISIKAETTIESIDVFNEQGQLIKTLAGMHTTYYELELKHSGVYTFRIFSNGRSTAQKVVVLD
jgi:hypothetical protein